LPLQCSDEMVFKYPIVGLWVAHIPGKSGEVVHPLVWSDCVRYLLTTVLCEKISPDPETGSFLFINFSHKPKFYEVSVSEPAKWIVLTCTKDV
jgi:hypothetical protein